MLVLIEGSKFLILFYKVKGPNKLLVHLAYSKIFMGHRWVACTSICDQSSSLSFSKVKFHKTINVDSGVVLFCGFWVHDAIIFHIEFDFILGQYIYLCVCESARIIAYA